MYVYRVLFAIATWSILVVSHPVETAQYEARQVLSSSSLAPGSLTMDGISVINTAAASVALSSHEAVMNISISGTGTMPTTTSDTRLANSTSTTSTAPAASTDYVGGPDGSGNPAPGTGVDTKAAIGGSIGGAAVVAVVIWWCLPARKQHKRSKETAKTQEEDTSQPTEKPTSMHTATTVKYRDSLEHSVLS